jgi:hypothetical protein
MANRLFKRSNTLGRTFRHDRRLHGSAFRAVAVLTQLAIENGAPLFGSVYDENTAF